MLIKKDCTGKTKSIYKCDRCKKVIDIDERFKIDVKKALKGSHVKGIKTWDLCKKCYISLYKGIEKGVTKEK